MCRCLRTTAGPGLRRGSGRGADPLGQVPVDRRAGHLAVAAMGQPDTKVGDLCAELGVSRQTLYRHVSPTGELRPDGERLLARR